ncbi:hypothetical protein LCGC14_1121860, partial [marine sediment metagenome]
PPTSKVGAMKPLVLVEGHGDAYKCFCDQCKKKIIEPRKLCGHHDDYNKPLEVQWLCYFCHCIVEDKLGHMTRFVKGFDPRKNPKKKGYFS